VPDTIFQIPHSEPFPHNTLIVRGLKLTILSYNTTMKLNELNSNLIFIFPIVASLLKGDNIYLFLSISIFIGSSLYHYVKENKRGHLNVVRYIDIGTATASYLYMFYFVHTSVKSFQIILYVALAVTVLIFFIGKSKFGRERNIHSIFHILIGIVAGVIPLLS